MPGAFRGHVEWSLSLTLSGRRIYGLRRFRSAEPVRSARFATNDSQATADGVTMRAMHLEDAERRARVLERTNV